MGFYDDMGAMVQELLLPDAQGGLGQGTVTLRRITTEMIDPEQDWLGNKDFDRLYRLKAAGSILHQRYERGVLIIETGMMLIVSSTMTLVEENGVAVAPQEVPFSVSNDDILEVNGVNRAISNNTPITVHGQPPAWKVWSKS